jgi:hypothetical protein
MVVRIGRPNVVLVLPDISSPEGGCIHTTPTTPRGRRGCYLCLALDDDRHTPDHVCGWLISLSLSLSRPHHWWRKLVSAVAQQQP